jgi:hypothetical protein
MTWARIGWASCQVNGRLQALKHFLKGFAVNEVHDQKRSSRRLVNENFVHFRQVGVAQLHQQFAFPFKSLKSLVALILLDGNDLSCLQICCTINGAEATTASHCLNSVAPSQNRSSRQQLPLRCPALGTHIGAQTVFHPTLWVWTKLRR